MKPAVYTRVSTEEQAKEGYSLRSQVERCNSLAKAKGLPSPTIYEDAGFSGARKDRPSFNRLIKDIEAGRISHVIVWRLDRLTRSMSQLVNFAEMIQERGVELISHQENICTDNAAGRLFLHQMGSFNSYFLELQKENIKAGMMRRATEGKFNATPPTGADLEDGVLVWNEKSRAVIKAFKLAAEDRPLNEVAKLAGLNASTVRGIIRNRAYIGEVPCGTGYVKGSHEPLIDQELFDRVQKIKPVSTNMRNRKAAHPLSGFVRCGKCRRAMSVQRGGRTGQVLSFSCRHRQPPHCTCTSRSAAKVERAFLAAGESLKNSPELREDLRAAWSEKPSPDVATEVGKLTKMLAGINRRIDKTMEFALDHDDTSDSWHDKLVELQEHREIIEKDLNGFKALGQDSEKRLGELEEMLDLFNRMTFSDIWEAGLPEERRAILHTYLKGITIYEDRLEIEFVNIPPFKIWWDEVGNGEVCLSMERETGLEPAT